MNAIYWNTYRYFWKLGNPLRLISFIMGVISDPIWHVKFYLILNPRMKRDSKKWELDKIYLKENAEEIEDLKEEKKEIYLQQYIRQLEVESNDENWFNIAYEMDREAQCFCYEGTTDDEFEDELYETLRSRGDYTDPKEVYGEGVYDALAIWFKKKSHSWNWADLHREDVKKKRKIKAWKKEVTYGE